MARTRIPEMTEERLSSRISLWMLSASQGNETMIDRIETTVATLGIVGFTTDVISQIVSNAASAVGLDGDDALSRFVPTPKATVTKRKRKNGASNDPA